MKLIEKTKELKITGMFGLVLYRLIGVHLPPSHVGGVLLASHNGLEGDVQRVS